jgi:4-hydroxy-tetrahydrodipicolinate reductase
MSSSPVLLGIAGAAGRMGRRLIALASEQPGVFKLAAALDAPGCPDLGKDAGVVAGVAAAGVAITVALTTKPQVMIDFSVPAATRVLLRQCMEGRIAMVIGTTGLTGDDRAQIDQAAQVIPVLQATNMSLGVNVLLAVAAQVARKLGAAYDIEIVEAHHNQKKDAPSGTALSLAESICKATGREMARDLVHGRHGSDAKRKAGTIGMHALRMGDVVGEHTVYFATGGERVELRHVATTRDTFVGGALRAAAFLAGAKAGRYTMADVLGLQAAEGEE